MDEEMETILEVFSAQNEEGLRSMEAALLVLEEHPTDQEELNTVFRFCHTLKGDAASLGFDSLAEFTHALEDLLAQLRSSGRAVTSEHITLLLQAVDLLRMMIADALEGHDDLTAEHRALLDRVQTALDSISNRAAEDGEGFEARQLDVDGAPDSLAETKRASTLRVELSTLDRLLEIAGELAIARGRLSQAFHDERESVSDEVYVAHRSMDHVFSELQSEVMQLRMVPIAPLFRQQHRLVRDMALRYGKQARLIIEGENPELDTAVTQHLRDPLAHMIRNAVIHGIEVPEERTARGKDVTGKITLRAYRDGASIVVEVADDGSGLDRERIRSRARTLRSVEDPDALSDAQLENLIFEPGFSTADESNLAAGRGVGMDVVRRNVEALGGSVRIESEPGRGTSLITRLPLTLAIIDGFAMGVGGEVFILPLGTVTECLDFGSTGRLESGSRGVINLRGASLPYARLGELLALPRQTDAREGIVVIEHHGERMGLAVDTLLGERQAVIKPLSRCFQGTAGLAGSTILGDGRVALVLDASTLLRIAADPNSADSLELPVRKA